MVSQMNPNYTTAEKIANRTWFLLELSRQPGVRLGEETLTDLLVLDLLMQPYSSVCVRSVTKPEETKTGADLMVYVRKDKDGAYKYAVQAKKLYPYGPYGRYGGLNNKAGSSGHKQIDVLEKYAAKCKAIPLYLLYNYIDDPFNQCSKCWHCGCKAHDKTQFGCSLVPSWHIRDAIDVRGSRNFRDIHLNDAALPWRCAFDCPQGANWRRIRKKFAESHKVHAGTKPDIDFEGGLKKWPGHLWGTAAPLEPSQGGIMRIGDEEYAPRWLILVDPCRD